MASIKFLQTAISALLPTVPKEQQNRDHLRQVVEGIVAGRRGETTVELSVDLLPSALPDEYALVSLHNALSDSLATLCNRVRFDMATQCVLATRPIDKGIPVTLQPWHAVVVGDVWVLDYACKEASPVFEAKNRHRVSVRTTEITHLIGDPQQTDKPQWLGHVLRDGVGNPFTHISDANDHKAIAAATVAYARALSTKCNCTMVQLATKTVIAVSTRTIVSGEELTVDRDPAYWYMVQFGIDERGLSAVLSQELTKMELEELVDLTTHGIDTVGMSQLSSI
jgi:sulfur transfer complex TusBCD TusB component (DsrH family)